MTARPRARRSRQASSSAWPPRIGVAAAALRDLGPRVSAVLRELKAAGTVDERAPGSGRREDRSARRASVRPPHSPSSRSGALGGARCRPRLSGVVAARRHREREDRGVPPGDGADARPRPAGALSRAGDQSHAAVGGLRPPPCATLLASCRFTAGSRTASARATGRSPSAARRTSFSAPGSPCSRPLPRLGLIVVDEEHDTSFKQQEGLRYSARDVAIMRAKQNDVPIVLGSATPALETYAQALSGRYGLLRLTARASGKTPAIVLVDTSRERLDEGMSASALDALARRLGRGEQTLVFINRRGYAPVLHCRACHWIAGCPRCSSRLVVHLQDQRLVCHLCGHRETLPVACAVVRQSGSRAGRPRHAARGALHRHPLSGCPRAAGRPRHDARPASVGGHAGRDHRQPGGRAGRHADAGERAMIFPVSRWSSC